MSIFSWLARRVARHLQPAPPPAPPRVSLDSALETLLVRAVEAQGKAAEARGQVDTEFIKAMAEIKAKTAAQTLGHLGGKERVRRMREKQAARDPTWCPVCKHDNARSNRAVIKWHMRGHAGARPGLELVRDNEQSRQTSADTRTQPDKEMPSATADADSASGERN